MIGKILCAFGFQRWARTGEATTVGKRVLLRYACERRCGASKWAEEGKQP